MWRIYCRRFLRPGKEFFTHYGNQGIFCSTFLMVEQSDLLREGFPALPGFVRRGGRSDAEIRRVAPLGVEKEPVPRPLTRNSRGVASTLNQRGRIVVNS